MPNGSGGMTVYTASDDVAAKAAENAEISLRDTVLTLKLTDAAGREIADPRTVSVPFDRASASFCYEITPPALYGYVYSSSDRELTGVAARDGSTVVILSIGKRIR